jgi:class 3 adenylate cyclase
MSPINTSDLTGRALGRKLIVIIHIDRVGYSRLIGIDDADTLSRLKTLLRGPIDPAVNGLSRATVQTAGDSLLNSFDSIDGAMRCAVKLQQQMPDYDGKQLPDRRIRLRIGIKADWYGRVSVGGEMRGWKEAEAVNVPWSKVFKGDLTAADTEDLRPCRAHR